MSIKYKAFISHDHSEYGCKYAVALEKALRDYAKPLFKSRIKIFRDEKEMYPGDDLGPTIKNALRDSEYFIYLASKEAAESKWIQEEMLTWCGVLKRIDKLIIIHLDGDIVTDAKTESIVWEKTNALPLFLQDYLHSTPVYVNLTWADKDESLEMGNIRFRLIINSITARFQEISPAEMDDRQILIDRRNKRIKNWTVGILFIQFISLLLSTWIAFTKVKRADFSFEDILRLWFPIIGSAALLLNVIFLGYIFYQTLRSPLMVRLRERQKKRISGFPTESKDTMRPIFISYSHRDKKFVDRLSTDLRNAGMKVWLDVKDIKVGDSISKKIEEGISGCDFFCLVISKHSIDSNWVEREFRTALHAQLTSGTTPKILPILVHKNVESPKFLADIKYADFSQNYNRGLEQLLDALKK